MLNTICNKIKNEYIFSVITKLIMVIVGIIHSVLLARYLGPALKGHISYIQSILSIGSIVLTMGVHHAYVFYRKNRGDDFISFFMNSVICFLICIQLLCFISAVLLHKDFFNFSVALSLMPLWAYTRISGTVFCVEAPNKRNATILALNIAEIVFLFLLFVFTKTNFALGVIAVTFVEIIQSIFFTYFIKFSFSTKFIDFKMLFGLLGYGFLPMISILLSTLNYRIDILMLKSAETVDLSQIGIYSIGIMLAEKALLIPDATKEILLSKLTKGKSSSEVSFVSRVSFFVCFFVAIFMVIVGKPFINIMYGSDYSNAYMVTAISVFGTIFMVFVKMICQYNIVNNKQITNVYLLSISIVTNIIFNILLIPSYGIIGASIATVCGHLVSSIAFVISFSSNTGTPIKDIVFLNKNDINVFRNFIH